MAGGLARGHEIYFNETTNQWLYYDDNSPIENNERPCIKCGLLPTDEGHDPCIKNLPNVKYACCGHGVELGYVKTEANQVFRFEPNRETEIVEFCKNKFKED